MNPLLETAAQIASGAITATSVVEAALVNIDEHADLHAFTTVCGRDARAQAQRCDQTQASGAPLGPLHGVPIAVKDNIDVVGVPTTCGARSWSDRLPATDADVVAALKRAGAVVIGKTNMDEFAWGGTGVNADFGTVRNPHHPDAFSAGSSAGSAVAVAAGLVSGAVGSDTGGSIRLPASVNGVVGLRPTVGRVSVTGVVPLAWTLDAVGPIASTVPDCAALYEVISRGALPSPTAGEPLRVGICEWFFENVDHDVEHAVSDVVEELIDDGVEVKTLKADWIAEYLDPWLTIHFVEPAAHFREELDRHPESFPAHVQELFARGVEVSGTEYARALRERSKYMLRCADLFSDVDALILPVLPFDAVAPGSHEVQLPNGPAPLFEALPRYTGLASMAGLPAISVPAATSAQGIPIGVQFVASWNMEHVLFALAARVESSRRGVIRV